jgi:UDP-N-acetylmuramyl pentapeptide synthase
MTIYDEYAILDAQIKVLEDQKDGLRVKILGEMVESGEDKIETSVGKFSVTKLKKWNYPKSVLKIGEDFKEAKARAESTGEATYTESESLRFTQIRL